MQVDCRHVGCERKGYWVEVDEHGQKRFCFRTRHDGEAHAVKLTLEEVASVILGNLIEHNYKLSDGTVEQTYIW